ncbi:MAG: hypothetical protein LBP95_00370 [Deltaproteobacteria bacterium]|jgi:nickel transport protein|nr:hypothetical protein [Deltaproteobacteria bacterium]
MLSMPGRASAHGVFIFAWAQGDQVCADSYFSGRSPVRGGMVTVTDGAGTELDAARTDEKGSVCFARPQTASDLTFAVAAGEGHRADFLLRAVDMPGPDPTAAPGAPEPPGLAASPASPSEAAGSVSVPAGPGPDLEAIRQVVRDEVGRQIGPVTRALAELDDPGPRLKDVVGGLGWLAGVFGFGFWYSGRGRRQKNAS